MLQVGSQHPPTYNSVANAPNPHPLVPTDSLFI